MMSVESCDFGRTPDGNCTDRLSFDQLTFEAGRRKRIRQRIVERALQENAKAEDVIIGENDD